MMSNLTIILRTVPVLLATLALVCACSHPIEIVGEGDVLSASGNRNCLLEDYRSGLANCTENVVTGGYDETYYGVPRSGWYFHRWANYCVDALNNECGFSVPAEAVEGAYGLTVDPLVAIFRRQTNTGYNALFVGHSFFRPFADRMAFHAGNAGFTDHQQDLVFSGGTSGAPEALWNDSKKRARIQGLLDTGEVALFGMTYHPQYPGLRGYRKWVDYALANNPDTRFFLALPWEPFPHTTDAATYRANWYAAHGAISHGIIDSLRAEYPGVDFYCIPYGQSAVELRTLFAAGQLPDVQQLTGSAGDAIFTDPLGHAGKILVALGELVWLRAIYGVSLQTYDFDPGYTAALKPIAAAIMDAHDPAYDAPE